MHKNSTIGIDKDTSNTAISLVVYTQNFKLVMEEKSTTTHIIVWD